MFSLYSKVFVQVAMQIFQTIRKYQPINLLSEVELSMEACHSRALCRIHRKIMLFVGLIMAPRIINHQNQVLKSSLNLPSFNCLSYKYFPDSKWIFHVRICQWERWKLNKVSKTLFLTRSNFFYALAPTIHLWGLNLSFVKKVIILQ